MKIKPIKRTIFAEVLERDISNDFMLAFADRSLFVFSFDLNEGDEEILLRQFKEQIVRLQRSRSEAGVIVHQAVLRFGGSHFAHLRGGPVAYVHVYASTAAKAEALGKKTPRRASTTGQTTGRAFLLHVAQGRGDNFDPASPQYLGCSG